MDVRRDQCLVAFSFATVALAPGASAETATASVRAEVVTPSEVGAAAAQLLVSNSPGVFALRIPGAAPATAIAVTAQSSGGGMIDFVASGESAEALETAIAQIAASAPTASGGTSQLVTAPADGTMSSHGVQIALSGLAPGADGGDVMIAVLAFD